MSAPRGTYHCPRCGSARVLGTVWVGLNPGVRGGDFTPPDGGMWCPDCGLDWNDGRTSKHVCRNNGTGTCLKCGRGIKEKDHDNGKAKA